MDLAKFLTARLDEDEGALEGAQWGDNEGTCYECGTNQARLLREVKAKRAILDVWAGTAKRGTRRPDDWCDGYADGERAALKPIMRALAAVYSDSPDFDPAWKE